MKDNKTINTFILSVIGNSGSGKTTLIRNLIPELKKRGYKVGTIKHTHHHDFDIDKHGKDSWEHQNAGADSVAISSSNKFAFIKKINEEVQVRKIIANCFADVDIVLVEGFKRESFFKIEVFRKGVSAPDVKQFSNSSSLLMVISDIPYKLPIAVFDPKEVRAITDIVENKMEGFYRSQNIEYLSSMFN